MGSKGFFHYLIVWVFAGYASLAMGGEKIEPLGCMYSEKNGTVKTQLCVQFERPLPDWCGITPQKTYKGLCVFRSGAWQRGNLKCKNGKPTIAKTRDCDRGVTMIRSVDNSKIIGPTAGVCPYDKKSKKFSSSGCTYGTNAVEPLGTTKKYLDNGEAPYLCYRKLSLTRLESVRAVRCANDPNEPNYCELSTLPKKFKGYEGQWWIQYTSKNQKKPTICKGGVEILNIKSLADEYETSNFAVQKNWIVSGNGAELADLNSYTSDSSPVRYKLVDDPSPSNFDEIVTGCFVKVDPSKADAADNLKLMECNSGGCRADENCADPDYDLATNSPANRNCFRDFVTGTDYDGNGTPETGCFMFGAAQKYGNGGKAEMNACFRDNGKWYITNNRVERFTKKYFHSNDIRNGDFDLTASEGKVSACYVIQVMKPLSK